MHAKDFSPIIAYICELELHDYVMYTSRDFGRLAITENHVVSNYALTYAIGRGLAYDTNEDPDQNRKGVICFPKSRNQKEPTYERDFVELPIYVTPAVSSFTWQKTRTYNTIPEIYKERVNPKYGKALPSFGRYIGIGIGSRFVFTILSEIQEIALPRYIRLGKFMASAQITTLDKCKVTLRQERGRFLSLPFHINDLPRKALPRSFDMVRLGKGHAIVVNAEFESEVWEFERKRVTLQNGDTFRLGDGLLKGVYYCVRGVDSEG
jgi:CRISPR type I-D-associated protein Csc1